MAKTKHTDIMKAKRIAYTKKKVLFTHLRVLVNSYHYFSVEQKQEISKESPAQYNESEWGLSSFIMTKSTLKVS